MAAKNPKNYVCSHENCNRSFTKESRLTLHTRTHTGEDLKEVCTGHILTSDADAQSTIATTDSREMVIPTLPGNRDDDCDIARWEPLLAVPDETISNFCGCIKDCLNVLDKTFVQSHIDVLRQMTKTEKELYIMDAIINISQDSKRSRYGDRKRMRYEYRYEGRQICVNAFMTIYDIRRATVKALIKHIERNGSVPRVHGNSGRTPHHAATPIDIERVVEFIQSYSNEHGLTQETQELDFNNPIFLPSYTTKKAIHALYVHTSEETDLRAIKYKAFLGIWDQYLPHIQIATPEDDVCLTCELMRRRIEEADMDEERFVASIELQQHVIDTKLDPKRPFTCEVSDCCKSYTRAAHLKRHEETAHCSSDEPVFCPIKYRCEEDGCESSFVSQQNLKKHVKRTHHRDIYTCHLCQLVFRKHNQLTRHRQKKHSQAVSYRCQVEGCGKSFDFPNRLKRHEKLHQGYKCDEPACQAIFFKWTVLRKHKMLHHSKGHHECRMCGKTFSQRQWLKKHMVIHRDSRETIECPYENCQREYFDLRNLNAHIHSYHEGKKFDCFAEGCGRSFASKQKLREHSRLHDPSKPPPKKKRPKKKTPAESLTGVSEGAEGQVTDLDDMVTSPSMVNLTPEDIEFTKLKTKSSDKSQEIQDTDSQGNVVDIIRKSVFSHKPDSQTHLEEEPMATFTENIVTMETNKSDSERHLEKLEPKATSTENLITMETNKHETHVENLELKATSTENLVTMETNSVNLTQKCDSAEDNDTDGKKQS